MANWDESNPLDTSVISAYPANERAARAAVKTNFAVDHRDTNDSKVGYHKLVHLLDLAGDPTEGAGFGVLYAKTVGGIVELHYIDSAGNAIQISDAGSAALLGAGNTWTGDNVFSSATNEFTGDGSGLTALNANNLASGTVPDARFPATLPAANGGNLTALNASNLASGTVPDARFPATLPAKNGSLLTSLNATNISSGTLNSARLPGVALRNVTSGQSSGSVTVSSSPPTGGSNGDIWLQV